MKKFILKSIAAAAVVFSLHTAADAQVSLSINIGHQPAWGPTGYNHVDYYYLPDIESYYDVATGQYIYQNNGQWIFANSLPPRYRGYDLYSGYKVVVNRPKPYLNFNRDRASYGRYKNWSGARQPMLRESRNAGRNRPGNNNSGGNRPGNMSQGANRGNINQSGNRPGNMNQGANRGNANQGGMNRGNTNQGQPQNRGGQMGGGQHNSPQGGNPGGGHDGGGDHGHH